MLRPPGRSLAVLAGEKFTPPKPSGSHRNPCCGVDANYGDELSAKTAGLSRRSFRAAIVRKRLPGEGPTLVCPLPDGRGSDHTSLGGWPTSLEVGESNPVRDSRPPRLKPWATQPDARGSEAREVVLPTQRGASLAVSRPCLQGSVRRPLGNRGTPRRLPTVCRACPQRGRRWGLGPGPRRSRQAPTRPRCR